MDILHTTFFGPIQWYQQLYRSECVYLDGNERWQKQTIRNRCYIATANGVQALSVPIVHHTSPVSQTKNILISDHGKWRTEHWNALMSAYGESPFFDYYADDIRPFFTEKWELLFDFNLAIIHKMCELLDIDTHPQPLPKGGTSIKPHPLSPSPKGEGEAFGKGGESLNPQPSTFTPYYQVYQQKHGFLPNLSILDLLFNMGNEAILYL